MGFWPPKDFVFVTVCIKFSAFIKIYLRVSLVSPETEKQLCDFLRMAE